MGAIKLLQISRPLGLSNVATSSMVTRPKTVMCMAKVGLSFETPAGGGGGGERKPVAAKAAGCTLLVSEPKTDKLVDLALLLAKVGDKMSHWMKFIKKDRPWRFHIQMLIEKAIIDCRFFTLLATAGSLLGSVLCFVEGCFLIVESYVQYFHSLSLMSEQGHVVLLLIEAIDMFLVGTAMLVFGMALHVMFVGHENFKGKGLQHTGSTLSRNLPSWIGMESAMQAKSKIGHAVIMILQVQLLEKFKNIPVTSGIDLACFAGAVFLSSASIFLLSRIAVARAAATR